MDASECGRLVVELVEAVVDEASLMRADVARHLLGAVGAVLRRALSRAEKARPDERGSDGKVRST